MAALLWLLIPLAGAVLASVWGGVAARRRTLVPDAVGVAAYDRFRRVMEDAAAPTSGAATPASGAANTADTTLGTSPAADPRAPTAAEVLAATDGPAREAH